MSARSQRYHLDHRGALALLEAALTSAAERSKLRLLLEGLLTPAQCVDLAQRLRVTHFLCAGYSYNAIRDETGASTATIAAVDRWLKRENQRYRRLYPIRRKRRPPRRQTLGDIDQDIPFSIKAFIRRTTGTAPLG